MANPVDLHVGKRLRQRRCLLGMTQQQLASSVGIKFQQVQKYESGANRISASRLWALSRSLDVPVTYFFEGLNGEIEREVNGFPDERVTVKPSVFEDKETIDLVRAYYGMSDGPRRRFLDLAKAMSEFA